MTLVRTATALAVTAASVSAMTVAAANDRSTSSSDATSTSTSESHLRRAAMSMSLALPFEGGHQRFIDTPPKGIGAGDMFLVTDLPVLDNRTGRRVGESDAAELILSARHAGTVTSQTTLRLRGGHVDIDGIIRHTDSPVRMTVTGGTGRYTGASGQLTILREDTDRKVTVMRLDLQR